MGRWWLQLSWALLVLLATAGPVAYAVHLAREQATGQDADRARRMAGEVLARVEDSARAVNDALARLAAAGHAPCSPQEQRLMRGLELGSGYIRALGRIEGSRLVCSPLVASDGAAGLGPILPTGPGPVQLRPDVRFPGAPGTGFVVIERDGFAAVVTKELPFDLTDWRQGEMLATVGFGGALFSERGGPRPRWLHMAKEVRGERILVEAGHVVAMVRSPELSVVAVAALPRSSAAGAANLAAMRALPIGVVAGLALLLVGGRMARAQRELPALLRAALREGELRLAYQPIVDMATGQPVAFEALLRWPRPHGTLVSPEVFVRVAEENGLIGELTVELFGILRRELPAGYLARHPPLCLAMNLSAGDLYDPQTLERIAALQAHLGAQPGRLKVEVTERSTTDMHRARAVLDGLRTRGVRVAIDDFGTGYSNLATLQHGRFDELKVDKAFVEAIGSGAASSGVVDHVIAMAGTLRCDLVAEGVETPLQAQYLIERGVRYAQGFLYARPMDFAALDAYLAASARSIHAGTAAVPAPADA